MSSKVQKKLVHVVLGIGLLLALFSTPTPPTTLGECSVQTGTC